MYRTAPELSNFSYELSLPSFLIPLMTRGYSSKIVSCPYKNIAHNPPLYLRKWSRPLPQIDCQLPSREVFPFDHYVPNFFPDFNSKFINLQILKQYAIFHITPFNREFTNPHYVRLQTSNISISQYPNIPIFNITAQITSQTPQPALHPR